MVKAIGGGTSTLAGGHWRRKYFQMKMPTKHENIVPRRADQLMCHISWQCPARGIYGGYSAPSSHKIIIDMAINRRHLISLPAANLARRIGQIYLSTLAAGIGPRATPGMAGVR